MGGMHSTAERFSACGDPTMTPVSPPKPGNHQCGEVASLKALREGEAADTIPPDARRMRVT